MQDINTFVSRIHISLRMRGDILALGRETELIQAIKVADPVLLHILFDELQECSQEGYEITSDSYL